MRAVIQRVLSATLTVDEQLISCIGKGLVVYLGVAEGDSESLTDIVASKIANMRIFSDENDKMNISALGGKHEILLVSQFTLLADTSHGNRPSYSQAMKPDKAKELYLLTAEKLKLLGLSVKLGVFGADMKINQVNDGPVTIIYNKD